MKQLITAALVACVALWLSHIVRNNRKFTYNDGDCKLIEGISPGSEDIAVVDNDLVLVSAGDLDRIFFKSKQPPRDGGIFGITFKDSRFVTTEKITLEGFPKHETINPHGISYSNTTGRVYAVSHECGERGTFEGIYVFVLIRDKVKGFIKLQYEFTILSPMFPLGGLNDVIEGSYLGEIYVTQWLSRPMSHLCAGNGNFFDEKAKIVDALFRRKTKVLRCVWDPESIATTSIHAATSCTVVADEMKGANGIASDPDKKRIFVNDATAKQMKIFDRNDNGSLSMKDIIDLPYLTDNIEFDVSSGKLTLVGTPFLSEALGRIQGDSSINVSGGMITVQPLNNGSYVIEEVIMHDGSKLSMISSAVYASGNILLGSPASDGVLMCRMPEQSISHKLKISKHSRT